MESKENSVKYLKWQLNTLKDTHEKFLKSWLEERASNSWIKETLETKIQALQEELEATKEKNEELKNALQQSQRDNQELVQDKAALYDQICQGEKIYRKRLAGHEQQVNDLDESFRKSLADCKKDQENVLIRQQEDSDKRLELQKEEADGALKEQAEKYEQELLKNKKKFDQNQRLVESLREQLTATEEALEKEINYRDTASLENRVMCKELEIKLEEQARIISDLQQREDLTGTVSQLKDTVLQKDRDITSKDRKIESLIEDKRKIEKELKEHLFKSAVSSYARTELMGTIKRLEDEKREEELKCLEKADELSKSKQMHDNLTEKLTHASYKVKAKEKEISNLRDLIQKKETYVLRIKEDIQACMTDIEDPKKLRHKVMILKKRHGNSDERVKTDANTPPEYSQHYLNFLWKKIETYEKIEESHAREKRHIQLRLEKSFETQHATRIAFIKVMNEKVTEVEKLKKELHKATKPKRIKSWINKKVLGVTQQIPDALPELYPEDWDPLGHSDDKITTSPQTDSDDYASLSSQPPPSTEKWNTQMTQFVDDGMPLVYV